MARSMQPGLARWLIGAARFSPQQATSFAHAATQLASRAPAEPHAAAAFLTWSLSSLVSRSDLNTKRAMNRGLPSLRVSDVLVALANDPSVDGLIAPATAKLLGLVEDELGIFEHDARKAARVTSLMTSTPTSTRVLAKGAAKESEVDPQTAFFEMLSKRTGQDFPTLIAGLLDHSSELVSIIQAAIGAEASGTTKRTPTSAPSHVSPQYVPPR